MHTVPRLRSSVLRLSMIFKTVVSRKLISDTQHIMYVNFTLAISEALSPTRISTYRRITTESLVVIQQAIHLHFLSFIPLASVTVFVLMIPSSVTWSQSLSRLHTQDRTPPVFATSKANSKLSLLPHPPILPKPSLPSPFHLSYSQPWGAAPPLTMEEALVIPLPRTITKFCM